MEKLDKILKDYVVVGEETKGKIFGAAFVVANKDDILYTGAAGRIDGPVDSPAFTQDSLTWLASMTKIITTACLMQLVERGQIKLEDDTRPLVSELAKVQILRGFDKDDKPILEDNTKPITLRELLTHTSGFAYDTLDPGLMKWSKAIGRTSNNGDLTLDGWNTPLKFAPGEGWEYSSGLDWAGQVLEKITGKGLGEYMAENLFKPLGMEETTFHRRSVSKKLQDSIVQCSYRNPEDGTLTIGPLLVPEVPPIESGGGGLHSTAKDYAKFLQALLAAGHGEGTILCKETVNEMFRPQLNDALCQMMKLQTEGILPFPPGTPLNHGISGVINTEDIAGKRRKGTLMWGGLSNGHWWIDREAGVVATLFVNVIPQPDPVVDKLFNELELAVYGDLLC